MAIYGQWDAAYDRVYRVVFRDLWSVNDLYRCAQQNAHELRDLHQAHIVLDFKAGTALPVNALSFVKRVREANLPEIAGLVVVGADPNLMTLVRILINMTGLTCPVIFAANPAKAQETLQQWQMRQPVQGIAD